MSERSELIAKLQSDFKARTAYIQAKVSTIVPSQIRALRMKSDTPRQPDLAHAAEMHQSRISTLETAGTNPTLSTLSAIAAALKVGLRVEFVPFSDMLAWENRFSQDNFSVTCLDNDRTFLNPQPAALSPIQYMSTVPLFRRANPAGRHSGTVFTNYASGDFSTVTGGSVHVLNSSPVQDRVGPTIQAVPTAIPITQQQVQVPTP